MINPEIFKIIKEHRLNESEVIYFCMVFHLKKIYPKAEDLLFINLTTGPVINLDNEEIYRTHFLRLEEGELVLKYPFIVKDKVNSFETFTKLVAETRLISSKGHVNNPQDYPVYDVSKETREAFNELPQLDLEKAKDVLIRYYETTKPAQKFSNYLKKGFIVDYQNFD